MASDKKKIWETCIDKKQAARCENAVVMYVNLNGRNAVRCNA